MLHASLHPRSLERCKGVAGDLMLIKADLHIHAAGDPADLVLYTARDVVNRARGLGLNCVAVTNHCAFTWDAADAAWALERGVLLVPGIEASIGGFDVLILNADAEAEQLRTFDDVRAYKSAERLIAAPHPFYPTSYSLGARIEKEIGLFDAIELSACYLSWHDKYNRQARALAARLGLPLIANSDAHGLWMMGTSWSEIDAEEFSVAGVIAAIKRGSVRTVAGPMSHFSVFRFLILGTIVREMRRRMKRWREMRLLSSPLERGPRGVLPLPQFAICNEQFAIINSSSPLR